MRVPNSVPWIGEEEAAAVQACLRDGWITEGTRSREFERRVLELTGSRYGVLAPNGTLALYLALRALEIGPGDEVIVPDMTFVASANAVEMTGALPIFADVSSTDFQMEPESALRWIGPRTRALMPVHLWGTTPVMEPILALAREHGLLVVEDAAQAIGVRHRGRHAGTFGHAGALSFFADKTITTAEGGMVLTDDAALHERLLHLRNQGRRDRGSFIHPEIGYNFRLTDLQAAVGLAQLEKLPRIVSRKQAIVARYRERLAGLDEVRWFAPPAGSDWIPFRIPLLCPRAPELMEQLRAAEIEPRTWFYPLHRQPCHARAVQRQLSGADAATLFPNADHAYAHGVCLPAYPTLEEAQIDHVCGAIASFYGKG